ncbi:cation transporter [Saccharopolyspora sp. K220]|uniref:heavy-metal-associated domain-containing protein n=1 Tax=Saccharopolyspora soli TaxID=2926618 RepID=UPI001F56CD3D|nr:heavy metal-associated domain-containing protein [Saccharopolyspora soli]MCI2420638.1 cation transporter [Saccharopolyspora soli]
MTTTATFRVTGMHCGSCSLLIDDVLEDLPGVHRTRTSVKDGRSVVELDLAKSGPADVIAAITSVGYQAEQIA